VYQIAGNRSILARIFIGVVLFFNLQAAVFFIFNPTTYAPGFELSGEAGSKLVQGMGILFLMWNVPYGFTLYNPIRFKISLLQAVIMQSIGFFGESILWLTLSDGHTALNATVVRFMAFDGSGLALLLIAFLLVRQRN
jgi:hypothetical protein